MLAGRDLDEELNAIEKAIEEMANCLNKRMELASGDK